MAKMSLLEIVNDIANDLDTEPVNDISDTIESVQIAQIVKTSFFELIASRNWPHLKRTINLDSVSDLTRPVYLKLPEETKEMVSFYYNKISGNDTDRDNYQKLEYLCPDDFLEYTNRRNVTNANITKITDFGGAAFLIRTDQQPNYFTSFDDEYLVLDSYNQTIENTVQSSNTQAIVYFDPVWVHDNNSVPDLPSEAFPLLVEEAKSTAFIVIKQQPNQKAEQKSRRQNAWLSRKAWKANDGVSYPNYGRPKV